MKKLLVILPLFLCLCAFAQKPRQWIKLGDEATSQRNYYGAALYFKKAYVQDESDLDLAMKLGHAYRMYNDYIEAQKVYQSIVDKAAPKTYPTAKFWLAMMLKHNGEYEQAEATFRSFYKKFQRKADYEGKKAKQEIKSCGFARRTYLDSADIKVTNPGLAVNTYDADFGAYFKSDSLLLISRMKIDSMNEEREVIGTPRVKMFELHQDGNTWKSGPAIDTNYNSVLSHNTNGCYNLKKDKFYFTRCGDDFICDIWVSEVQYGTKFGPPKRVEELHVPGYTTTQPMIAEIKGKEVMFFASNRPRGKGKMDIWYTVFKGSKYGNPKNAGKGINSIDNEISPFYDANTKNFYFSSNWHYGFGGYDIFVARGGLRPKKPKNMLAPYNSGANDMYFAISPNGKKGVLSSNRAESFTNKGETCCNDIYEFRYAPEDVPDTTEIVYKSLEDLNRYLPVKLYFHNDRPNPKNTDKTTKLTYHQTYNSYLELEKTYEEEYSKNLHERDSVQAVETIQNFFIHKVEKGVDDLELFNEFLLEELRKGQRIKLTIKGFASPLAKSDYNTNLTLRRISSLVNELKVIHNGDFVPFINGTDTSGGKLEFYQIPFGEFNSHDNVSDNLYDQRNSVYSKKAALERKIEIISATRIIADSSFAEVIFDHAIHNFGIISDRKTKTHKFFFTNTGNQVLRIKNMVPDGKFAVMTYSSDFIEPGKQGWVEIGLDPANESGKTIRKVTVHTNGVKEAHELFVTGNIQLD